VGDVLSVRLILPAIARSSALAAAALLSGIAVASAENTQDQQIFQPRTAAPARASPAIVPAPATDPTSTVAASGGVTLVPPGNRHAEQPGVPAGSANRTSALGTTYERKYQKVYELLRTDNDLRRKIAGESRA
jgi:hypothetical protein